MRQKYGQPATPVEGLVTQDAALDPALDHERVSANRDAELAILKTIMYAKRETADRVISILQERDFYYDDTEFVFGQLAEIRASGSNYQDIDSVNEWLRLDLVGQTFIDRKLERYRTPLELFLKIVVDGPSPNYSAIGFYISDLRKWRTIRGCRAMLWTALETLNEDHNQIDNVLTNIEQGVAQLRAIYDSSPILKGAKP